MAFHLPEWVGWLLAANGWVTHHRLSARLASLEKSMFPLSKRTVSGYAFGQPTFYSAHHLGTDYEAAEGTALYAPFDGTVIEAFSGIEGGKTVWFRPDGTSDIIRFLHLSEFRVPKGTHAKEGELIALTGHTGRIVGNDGKPRTYAPHLHTDISKGSVVLAFKGNFTDPEGYAWETRHDTQEGNVAQAETASVHVPVEFTVRSTVRVNWRDRPSLSGKVMATYDAGTEVLCDDSVGGDFIVSTATWFKSKKHGWYSTAAYNTHL